MPDSRAAERPPIAVLLGGPSAEHDVSVTSGSAIAAGLEEAGYRVQRVLIDLDGGWWWLPSELPALPLTAYDDPVAIGASGPLRPGMAVDLLAVAEPRPVVFIALHGPFGEDGTVQAMLDGAGLAYTGAGVTASAIGMDKAVFKRLVGALGMPVVEHVEVSARRWATDRAAVLSELEEFAAGLGEVRLMVKPAGLGSSVGMTVAHRADERDRALDEAFRFDSRALVERYLPAARELEVGVLGNDAGSLEVFGPGEIVPGHEFYDYVAKYTAGVSQVIAMADVPSDVGAATRDLAARAFLAIGGEGLARVDFLYAGGRLVLSELNTIPGFTPVSLYPRLAASAGHPFPELCDRIVRLALERQAGQVRRRLTAADLPR